MDICPNCFSTSSNPQQPCMKCGFYNTVPRDARALSVGFLLHGRYVVGRVLGIGGFGITYVAYDKQTRIRLAIKEYFPAEWAVRTSPGNSIVPNSQSREKLYLHGREVFVNEAGILNKLEKISSVVNVMDFFAENGTAYMVMELVDGYTLTGYLKSLGTNKLSYVAAGKIVTEVGKALHQVHNRMLLHRDVGPDNIMITKNGDIRLIDFGATRMYALNSPKSMSVLVKPGFAPIEQYSRAGNQGPWTDVYALAATYYFLVSGRKPPEAPDRIAGCVLVPLVRFIPGIPPQISAAVEHALAENWRERPKSIGEFLFEMGFISKKGEVGPTIWVWDDQEKKEQPGRKKNVPCLLMQVKNERTRYYFMTGNSLSVGRSADKSNIILSDSQVSGLHCRIFFDAGSSRFMIQNYSANRTYTSQGVLEKNQGTYLVKGEWFYIQTMRGRYIFYLEVE